jgi:ATP-binding cassette subfamily B protein RaxB
MERVIEVARMAAVHDEIAAMPMAYETLVGDMGSVLSGGQKQRVLLARALYPDPAVLFMDEGTAHLDPASERQVMEALKALPITRIVSAHRDAAIEAADHICRLDGGSLTILRREAGPAAPDAATGAQV